MDKKIKTALCALLLSAALYAQGDNRPARDSITGPGSSRNEGFTLERSSYGISGLWKTGDLYPTNYIRKGKKLGEVTVRYRQANGVLDSVKAGGPGGGMPGISNWIGMDLQKILLYYLILAGMSLVFMWRTGRATGMS